MPTQTTVLPLQTNPYPLGAIKPTAGTPLPLSAGWARTGTLYFPAAGFTDIAVAATTEYNLLTIQILPGNSASGLVYILNNASPADTVNYTNVLGVLSATAPVFNNIMQGIGALQVNQIWIDVSHTTDGVLGNVRRA
jgi:hypothetical protein